MTRRFYTLDVFTDRALAGNPLAVVLDSEGLDTVQMQAVVTEFNLSETVFVSPPQKPIHGAAIRIFTPAYELPFAGHPTVGTAILLNHLNHLGVEDEFILEEEVGPVNCVISSNEDGKRARFDLPKVATQINHPFDIEGWASALGLNASAMDVSKGELWDGGVPYTMVPVRSIEYVAGVEINAIAIGQVEPQFYGIGANPYVFCKGGEASDADFHARMFAPNFGIPEDPATGSAVASLSGWIAKHEMGETDRRRFKIEQGYEMGRPSQIYLDIEKQDGKVIEAGISGSAVLVSEGALHF